jgi:hypothetical protein
MAAPPDHSSERPAGSPLGGEIAAHLEAIVRAAQREAQAAERAIEERRRTAEQEARRYLAAARLHVDAEAAARAARLEALGTKARQLAEELSDAAAAITQELRRADEEAAAATLPRTPWLTSAEPAAPPPAPPSPPAEPSPEPSASGPTWARAESEAEIPSAARLVAIEMAVGGSSRAEVELHLREQLGLADPEELLDDVFGAASHAGSRLAWGEA